MSRRASDRGAAAVEFALVLPLLLLLTLGIIAFGHAFHIQSVLDNAARDAVRILALQDDGAEAAAEATAIASAATSVDLEDADADIAIAPAGGCDAGQNARVTITLDDFQLLGGIGSLTLTGTGTMRCNG